MGASGIGTRERDGRVRDGDSSEMGMLGGTRVRWACQGWGLE